jgi:hypothetical protein
LARRQTDPTRNAIPPLLAKPGHPVARSAVKCSPARYRYRCLNAEPAIKRPAAQDGASYAEGRCPPALQAMASTTTSWVSRGIRAGPCFAFLASRREWLTGVSTKKELAHWRFRANAQPHACQFQTGLEFACGLTSHAAMPRFLRPFPRVQNVLGACDGSLLRRCRAAVPCQ